MNICSKLDMFLTLLRGKIGGLLSIDGSLQSQFSQFICLEFRKYHYESTVTSLGIYDESILPYPMCKRTVG